MQYLVGKVRSRYIDMRKFLINKTLSIYFSLFKAVCCFFIFAMHKKLSDSRALLLKLAEDKNTGCMPYS